ncbi:MAG: FemAB family XrtA/PEP-CTERM system-associated protein [Pseudomonadota bacterium]
MNDMSPSSPVIKVLDHGAADQWDAFVLSHERATFFHRAGWKEVIERSFGHRCHFLYAERAGAVSGVLPLVHVKSALFGSSLVSNAFCVYGGPVARDPTSLAALDREAQDLAQSLGVDYLEYRLRDAEHPDWASNSELYATFRKALDPEAEKNLQAVPRKQRAMVRKGIKAGLTGQIDRDIGRFFRIYSESVRNLGTPVFGRRYFETLKAVFGSDCEVLTVAQGDRALASVMSFTFRDEVLPYYGGGLPEARGVAAYDFMYWEVMRRACEDGIRVFDFGRSKRGTGAFSFKKHWGFEPEALHYEYKLLKASEIPSVNPLNPKYRLYIALWKRLPLAMANRIGPVVARALG